MVNKFLFTKELRRRFAEIDRVAEIKLQKRLKEIEAKYKALTKLRLEKIENEYAPMIRDLKSMQRKVDAIVTDDYEILGKILLRKKE